MAVPMCTAGRWDICFGTLNGVAFLALAALPLAAVAVWVLARGRRAVDRATAWRLSLAEVGMVYGSAPWVWITLQPGAGAGVVPGRLSLVPLRDLLTMGTGGIIGNLLVFATLGYFAPVRFAALASFPRVLALGAACSVLIETTQYVLWLDRVSSVDDVLLNATGAGLAALASRHRWRTTVPVPAEQPRPAPARVA